jgi:WhiB family redox-sensing transcriptional regulator
MSWQDEAACAGVDQALFFPERTQDAAGAYEVARRYCARCPVLDACLRYALDHPDMPGFWAGTTWRDRRNLRAGGSFRRCVVCDGPYVMARRTNDPYCSFLCFRRSYRRSA